MSDPGHAGAAAACSFSGAYALHLVACGGKGWRERIQHAPDVNAADKHHVQLAIGPQAGGIRQVSAGNGHVVGKERTSATKNLGVRRIDDGMSVGGVSNEVDSPYAVNAGYKDITIGAIDSPGFCLIINRFKSSVGIAGTSVEYGCQGGKTQGRYPSPNNPGSLRPLLPGWEYAPGSCRGVR